MGIGIPIAAADEWLNYDSESYNALYTGDSTDQYRFFYDLPDWAYQENVGPFYIDGSGAIWGVSMNPSQDKWLYDGAVYEE